MGTIISVVNQKGGVGKTTTAVNLGAYLAYFGKRVLLIDLDPQANATSGLGINHREIEKGIYNVLIGNSSIIDVILKTKQNNYFVIPATISLSGASVELVDLNNREFRLDTALKEVKDKFDYIIIDGPPSLGLLTVNGLTASDKVLIPIQSEYYALEGLGQLLETISLIQNNLKPELGILGVVITMFDKRNRLSSLVKDELYKYFPNKVFKSIIPRSVRLAEAPSYGSSILQYDAKSLAAKAYEDLAKEIINSI
ncbi:MAG: ParA family protein [Candidatus ainarchaeum sp.]|nr:ParA family protein [Candidatus ainarchaeum sp.]